MTAKEQRAALIAAIRKRFPDIELEYSSLPWLRVPTIATLDGPLKTIFRALRHYRGYTAFATEGRKLACDIVIPSQRLIIEYDERQHFSAPRAIALRLYPNSTRLSFEVAEWIRQCNAIAATDNDPPYRDEQRAFYDSVRDILAASNDYRIVRLRHGAFDWRSGSASEEIMRRLPIRQDASSRSSPRFASVCVKGFPTEQYRNVGRLKLLANVVKEINRRWDDLDAVIFPGGFLRLDRTIGDLPYGDRVKALNAASLVSPMKSAARALSRSKGALIVFGVDGPRYSNGDCGDQLCAAANSTGIVGLGRKVFPVKGNEANEMRCYDADFREAQRIVKLPCGRRAVLCACYDMFGVAEGGDPDGTRARNVAKIGTSDRPLERGARGFHEGLERNVSDFKDMLAYEDVTIGIAAIHSFEGHSTGFWQRHGIAACSAALKSGFAIGAAHFEELPQKPNSSTLSAARVPKQHLTQGVDRKAHSWSPIEDFQVVSHGHSALVRLFG